MIGLRDTLTLALTKTRTRKVRTLFTVIIAGLLFSLIMTILLVTQGFFQNTERMNKQAMTGRYILSANPVYDIIPQTSSMYSDPEVIARAQKLYDARIVEMKQEAKRIGIEFDPNSEPKPYGIVDSEKNEKELSVASPIGRMLMAEINAKNNPQISLEHLKKIATVYQPTAFYETHSVQPAEGLLQEMMQGKESFDGSAEVKGAPEKMMNALSDIQEATLVPQGMVSLYMLEDHGWQPASDRIPVIITQKRAASMLGFSMPTGSVSAEQKLQYMKELRQKAKGATFTACYRNSVSQERISEAQMVAKDIAANKNNRDYVKPALIYGLPDATSCGPVSVARDVRSADEKLLTNKQNEFKRKFGAVVDPVERKVTFQVVGIAPNSGYDSYAMSSGVGDIITSLLASQSFRFAIPDELYSTLTTRDQYDQILSKRANADPQAMIGNSSMVYVEFSNADLAREFSKNESCTYTMTNECLPKDKQIVFMPYGSNSLGIADAQKAISTFLFWLTVVIVALAAIISSLTIGRMIADGRRETAVFRAIGFKRLDIAQVYFFYTLLICIGIIIVSAGIAFTIAYFIDRAYWVQLTTAAQLALGLPDGKGAIHLIGMSVEFVWVVLAIVLSGLLGMSLPLLRNIRRNPIRDMRDE